MGVLGRNSLLGKLGAPKVVARRERKKHSYSLRPYLPLQREHASPPSHAVNPGPVQQTGLHGSLCTILNQMKSPSLSAAGVCVQKSLSAPPVDCAGCCRSRTSFLRILCISDTTGLLVTVHVPALAPAPYRVKADFRPCQSLSDVVASTDPRVMLLAVSLATLGP